MCEEDNTEVTMLRRKIKKYRGIYSHYGWIKILDKHYHNQWNFYSKEEKKTPKAANFKSICCETC